jgi:NitT/TauT family transport system ATP-binding protein
MVAVSAAVAPDQTATAIPGTGLPAVAIKDVTIAFQSWSKTTIVAVDSVSVDIPKGEKFVLLGPSGCGKSTLLTAIAGFMPVTSGSIEINGKIVRHPSMSSILVFQDFGQLFPWRTVAGNVEWALRRRWPKMSAAEIRERAAHYVDLVGLSTQVRQYPNTLSGGQKQRCAIARAFAVSPDILLMDEPFGALDAINRERMQAELNRLWNEAEPRNTVVFVTHDVNEAVHLGHKIMVMSHGPGRLRTVLDNPHVGVPPYDGSATHLVSELRDLLKEET